MNVADKVREIIAEHCGVSIERVTPEAQIVQDLGADSLDTVELLMAIEEVFGISVPEAEAQTLTTVDAIIACVQAKFKKCDAGGDAPHEPPSAG